MTAPAGTEVGLYVDLVASVSMHDIIETQTGRRYLVTSVRVQERGKHVGRQHLRAVVLPDDYEDRNGPTYATVPTVHRIRWYRRAKRKR